MGRQLLLAKVKNADRQDWYIFHTGTCIAMHTGKVKSNGPRARQGGQLLETQHISISIESVHTNTMQFWSINFPWYYLTK